MIRFVRLGIAALFLAGGVLAAPHLMKYVPQSWTWTEDVWVLAAASSVVLLLMIGLIVFPGKPKPRRVPRASVNWIPDTDTSGVVVSVPQWYVVGS